MPAGPGPVPAVSAVTANVGIVGCGVIASQYLRTIERLPELRLVAVADLDLERRSLVRALLVNEVRRAVDRTFDEHPHQTEPQRPGEVPKVRSFFVVCPAELCKSCTCGCYQPEWSPNRNKSCRERCECPCDCCECCDACGSCNRGCCDCCRCCKRCDCDCDCCDCG